MKNSKGIEPTSGSEFIVEGDIIVIAYGLNDGAKFEVDY